MVIGTSLVDLLLWVEKGLILLRWVWIAITVPRVKYVVQEGLSAFAADALIGCRMIGGMLSRGPIADSDPVNAPSAYANPNVCRLPYPIFYLSTASRASRPWSYLQGSGPLSWRLSRFRFPTAIKPAFQSVAFFLTMLQRSTSKIAHSTVPPLFFFIYLQFQHTLSSPTSARTFNW